MAPDKTRRAATIFNVILMISPRAYPRRKAPRVSGSRNLTSNEQLGNSAEPIGLPIVPMVGCADHNSVDVRRARI
jgi:hypothetical protein